MIHGGPHGQQGPAFNAKAQVYAAKGYGVLMVNYRGSTGYGQKFADAIFNDQDGGEAKDVLAGVDAALGEVCVARREPPRHRRRQLRRPAHRLADHADARASRRRCRPPASPTWSASTTCRTTTTISRWSSAAAASAVEDERQAAPRRLSDFLWERSALRYVANVKTPVMFVHGENDNDVPIAEAEQYFIALKDAGVETMMVRYPREGHGVRETKHQVDVIDRSIAWYEKHFQSGSGATRRRHDDEVPSTRVVDERPVDVVILPVALSVADPLRRCARRAGRHRSPAWCTTNRAACCPAWW